MKYDMTGKTNNEVNKEVVRLADIYETVEVVRKDGKVILECRNGERTRNASFSGQCDCCKQVGRVQEMDSGYTFCKLCWNAMLNRIWEIVEEKKKPKGTAG